MKTALIIGGVFNVLCALSHIGFWKIFDWKKELASLQPINRGIMQTLNIVLIYGFIGAATLSFLLLDQGVSTGLERGVMAFIGGIFLLRAAVQYPLFGRERPKLDIALVVICILAGGNYIWIAL